MPLLRPIRNANFTPQQNSRLYFERISTDVRLRNQNELIRLGNCIFNNVTPQNLIQPFGQALDLSMDFWDSNTILGNGLHSVRSGFYKIIKKPELKDIAGVATWAAYVLYNRGNNLNEHFLYYANVGTIVNRYAFGGNLVTNQLISLPVVAEKESFLNGMLNEAFYVSRAEFVADEQFGRMKEVLWFKLN